MRILSGKWMDLYIWRNIQLNKSRTILFIVLFMLSFALFALNIFPYSSFGLVLIPLAFVLGIKTYQNYATWSAGSRGEEDVVKQLTGLGDEYILLNSIVVPPNRGDIDHTVVGPNGIFVIESKNYSGDIYCDGDEWKREKTSRSGRQYEIMIGSPSNQAKRNAKVLKDYILAHKKEIFKGYSPHIWVHAIVIFTNPKASVSAKNPTIEIIELKELDNFIKNTKSERNLEPKEIEKISRLLRL